jgi:hypothetical protein
LIKETAELVAVVIAEAAVVRIISINEIKNLCPTKIAVTWTQYNGTKHHFTSLYMKDDTEEQPFAVIAAIFL